MGKNENDIRAVTIKGNLYWMPKTEAEELIKEFVKDLRSVISDNSYDNTHNKIEKWEAMIK